MFSQAHKDQLSQEGFCVLENVLSKEACAEARAELIAAAEESRRRGVPTYIDNLDPNDANVRVFNLLDRKPVIDSTGESGLKLNKADGNIEFR